MKVFKLLVVLSFVLFSTNIYCQTLPSGYQAMFNEIVQNFKSIRGGNSITQGKNTLSVLNDNKVALRIEHKKQVKNLTFETTPDEENNLVWEAVNELTIDMVNKYEDDLTKILDSMLKLSEKKAKE